jgi:hypothetical protein
MQVGVARESCENTRLSIIRRTILLISLELIKMLALNSPPSSYVHIHKYKITTDLTSPTHIDKPENMDIELAEKYVLYIVLCYFSLLIFLLVFFVNLYPTILKSLFSSISLRPLSFFSSSYLSLLLILCFWGPPPARGGRLVGRGGGSS